MFVQVREFLVTVTVKKIGDRWWYRACKNAPAQLWLMEIPTSAAIKFALTLARPSKGYSASLHFNCLHSTFASQQLSLF